MKIARQLLIVLIVAVLGGGVLAVSREFWCFLVVVACGGWSMAWWDWDEVDRGKVRQMTEMVREGWWG